MHHHFIIIYPFISFILLFYILELRLVSVTSVLFFSKTVSGTSLGVVNHQFPEFCTRAMLNFWRKGPPIRVKCQKRPPTKKIPDDTCHVPPGPNSASPCRHPKRRHVGWRPSPSTAVSSGGPCRHSHSRHAGVALATWAIAGTLPCHASMPALAQAAGPTRVTAVDSVVRQETCRRWGWRQGLAGFGPGGTWHVSPGQTCRHWDVVLFDNFFCRWSFLTFDSHRWFFSSKNLLCLG
jgi:hypothetical protein